MPSTVKNEIRLGFVNMNSQASLKAAIKTARKLADAADTSKEHARFFRLKEYYKDRLADLRQIERIAAHNFRETVNG